MSPASEGDEGLFEGGGDGAQVGVDAGRFEDGSNAPKVAPGHAKVAADEA